jgi:hypothetical protein
VAEQGTRHRCPHHGELEQLLGVGTDRGPAVEKQAFSLEGRPQTGNRGAVDFRRRLQANLGHRHQRAGIAGRNGEIGGAGLHRIDRQPHARLPAAAAERLARTVVHAHGNVGVGEGRCGLDPRVSVEDRAHSGLIAKQGETDVRVAGEQDIGARDDDLGTLVSAHHIERSPNDSRHRL